MKKWIEETEVENNSDFKHVGFKFTMVLLITIAYLIIERSL